MYCTVSNMYCIVSVEFTRGVITESIVADNILDDRVASDIIEVFRTKYPDSFLRIELNGYTASDYRRVMKKEE